MPRIKNIATEALVLAGDEWVPVDPPTGPTKKARARLFIAAGVFNPKSYGAIGNGIADDTAAIQAAIDAAQAVKGTVRFDPGTYRTTATLVITSSVRLEGAGALASIVVIDAANTTILRSALTVTEVQIENILWRGNQTGLGGLATGTTGGHGLAFDRSSRVRVRYCAFEKIGVPIEDSVHGQYASPIVGSNVIDATVLGCFFEADCHNRTGADISLTGSDLLVTGNKSRSSCDSHVSLGKHSNGETRHTVAWNQAYRAPGTHARSGVLVFYDGTDPAFADISHNQLSGFYWNGIYSTCAGGTDAGSITIGHNTIAFCGGGWGEIDTGTVAWPGAGIRAMGRAISIVGNTIYGTGYEGTYGDLAARPNGGTGILCLSYLEHSSIIGNTIRKSTDGGIRLDVQGSNPNDTISCITIANNVVEDNLSDGISVIPQRTNAECITNVKIKNNVVRVVDATANGVCLKPTNGAWANRIDFDENNISHASPPVSGFAAAIQRSAYTDYTRNTGRVVGNTTHGFRTGITFTNAAAVMYVPCAVFVDGNNFQDAQLGIDFSGGANWGIHSNSTGSIAGLMSNNGARAGRIIGSVTGRPAVEMMSDTQPTSGAFIAGDVQLYFSPRGNKIGNRCVTSGSPGFWVPILREDPFGHYARARSVFNVSSLEVTGIDPAAVLAVGTPTPVAWDTNRYYTRRAKLEYLDTSAGTDSIGGVYTDAPEFSRVVAFYNVLIWAPATGMSVGTRRGFAGMVASNAAPTDVDPSTQTQMIGMGWDDDDTQVQIMHAAAGAATKVALGASFPRPSVDRTLVYALEIYSQTAGDATIVRASELSTGVMSAETFITGANRPTAELNPFTAWCSVGGTSGVAGAAVLEWRSWRGGLALG